jgi:hypothetical protein
MKNYGLFSFRDCPEIPALKPVTAFSITDQRRESGNEEA